MNEVTCSAKHTAYQPTDEEFKCPKCGSTPKAPESEGKARYFIIDDLAEGANSACEKLHDEDVCVCHNCDSCITGKRLAARIAKEKDLVCCPACKGKAYVDKIRAEDIERSLMGRG